MYKPEALYIKKKGNRKWKNRSPGNIFSATKRKKKSKLTFGEKEKQKENKS